MFPVLDHIQLVPRRSAVCEMSRDIGPLMQVRSMQVRTTNVDPQNIHE